MGLHLFLKNQNVLDRCIHETTWEIIGYNGKEEACIALEEGHLDIDNIPFITVIADGA